MVPAFLLSDNVVRNDGNGAPVPIDPGRRSLLEITLGITRVLEKESLQVSIWGSADGETWWRLRAFPPKSYCGNYTLLLDLSPHPEVRFLRANWSMSRWSLADEGPVFGFSIEVKPAVPEKKTATSVGAAVAVA